MSIGSNINRIYLAKESIQKTLLKSGANVQGVIDNYKQPILDTPKRVLDLICKTVNNSNAKNVNLTMIDVSNVTSLDSLFFANRNIQNLDVSNWDTSNVTSMHLTFESMNNLKSIECADWDVSNVTDFSVMFDDCYNLQTIDVSKWNTSSATNMSYMFSGNALKTLDVSNFNTSKVTNMNFMFSDCFYLTHLDISNFDTSNVLKFNSVFAGWRHICKELNISGLNLERCTSINNVFNDSNFKVIRCDGLKLPNIDMRDIGLHTSTALTVDSIVGLLNALPQSDKGYSFQIGSDNIAKLSDEQKAIATNKGWTLI